MANTSEINPNWSELHEDLLHMIARKLITVEDFTRFGGVCRPWRSATLDKHQFPLFSKPLFPWLMITKHNAEDDYCQFFSPLANKIHRIKLPEARRCRCWGSPFGWLVTCCHVCEGIQLHLLNPMSQTRIPLPLKLTKNGRSYGIILGIAKATIVSIMELDDSKNLKYFVFAIIDVINQLAFTRDGENTWTILENTTFQEDFLHLNGEFYAMKGAGYVIYEVDIHSSDPLAKKCADPPVSIGEEEQCYLVELDGELHMAVRKWDCSFETPGTYKTGSIVQVYKFDRNRREWEDVQNLRDNVVFLGRNTSFALKASDYPECKPDCIYFTDEKPPAFFSLRQVAANDMGIFNMETRKIESLYEGEGKFSQTVWITPRLI